MALIYLQHKHLEFVQIWNFETTRLIVGFLVPGCFKDGADEPFICFWQVTRIHEQVLASRLTYPHATDSTGNKNQKVQDLNNIFILVS